MGPQDPKDVTRNVARERPALVGELAALKGRYPLANRPGVCRPATPLGGCARATSAAALVEARRRVRIDEGR